MTQPALWTQEQLAQHWLVSEGTLERWRCEGIGPVFLKIRATCAIELPTLWTLRSKAFARARLSP
jgi:hypothetical protein